MRVSKEDECWVCNGGSKPHVFKFKVDISLMGITVEQHAWLGINCPKGYGEGYYYSHGELWFRHARDETAWLLRWS